MTAQLSYRANALPPPSPLALDAERALSAVLSGRVSSADQDRLCYSRDMWPKALIWIREGRIPPPPDLVVWPKDEPEVQAVVRLCRERKLPLIPFGAGSGVCGGVWAVKGGVSMDVKRLEEVAPVNKDGLFVDAQAGVIGELLERKLNAQGFTLGHFPSSIYMSTLGGWLAARSAGQLSNKYGKIEDMALSVRAVLGTGELLVTPERPFRGPDVAQLLIGSEGTLCTFTGARLRVHPVAEKRTYRGVRFRTVADGVDAIRRIFRAGLRPAVIRLYDPFDTAIVGKNKPHAAAEPPSLRGAFQKEILPRLTRTLSRHTLSRPNLMNKAADLFRHCLLIVLFEGEEKRVVREDAEALALCEAGGGHDEGEAPGLHWFKKRYDVSYKMSKVLDRGAFADTMEVATTWDKVIDVYDQVRAAVSPHAFVMCHFSHAYLEGCSLYFSFVSSTVKPEREDEHYDELWAAALGAATRAGGNVSHHHGVGILKAEALRQELGDGRDYLVGLKRAFDPDGVMNPGKLTL